jgi:hypothetical protein
LSLSEDGVGRDTSAATGLRGLARLIRKKLLNRHLAAEQRYVNNSISMKYSELRRSDILISFFISLLWS